MQGANKRDGIKLPHVSKHIIMNINNFKSTNLPPAADSFQCW